MRFVTVYCPLTITGAGVALLQFARPRFVTHCNEKPCALVGHLKTIFVFCFDPLSSGPPVVKVLPEFFGYSGNFVANSEGKQETIWSGILFERFCCKWNARV